MYKTSNFIYKNKIFYCKFLSFLVFIVYFYINDLNTIYIYLVLTFNKYLHKCKPKHNVVWT